MKQGESSFYQNESNSNLNGRFKRSDQKRESAIKGVVEAIEKLEKSASELKMSKDLVIKKIETAQKTQR